MPRSFPVAPSTQRSVINAGATDAGNGWQGGVIRNLGSLSLVEVECRVTEVAWRPTPCSYLSDLRQAENTGLRGSPLPLGDKNTMMKMSVGHRVCLFTRLLEHLELPDSYLVLGGGTHVR